VFLVITDDELPPWVVVSGAWNGVRHLLSEARFFEFFVVNTSLRWIVFDTHDNRLVVGGDRAALPRGNLPA
jgi:hypothetical protein